MSDPVSVLDAAGLRAFLCGGCERLGANQKQINALNVFPVPDGDTGVNMFLTVSSGRKKLLELPESANLGQLAQAFSLGTLMGARGNSGVILSQMFRGLALQMNNLAFCEASALAAAFQKGVELAYKSVMKPVEGTILTVFRFFAAACRDAAEAGATLPTMLQGGLEAGARALADTPRLLPVLKEAGVVDAGGQGLLTFLEGACAALTGLEIPTEIAAPAASAGAAGAGAAGAGAVGVVTTPANARDDISTADIKFTYCTQLLITGDHIPVDEIRQHLSTTPPGDSLLVVGDENLVKIHFHNNEPAQVLAYCSRFGAIHDVIVDDMREQHHDNMAAAYQAQQEAEKDAQTDSFVLPVSDEHCACGVVAVAAGEGLTQLYRELGACVIQGGQTMNPSAADILNAIDRCPAEQVVVLPNNKNIIMAAEQAVSMSQKPACVVKTKHVTQGLSVMLGYDPNLPAADVAVAMEEAAALVVNGELTYAVRDTHLNGLDIHQGDLIAVGPDGISGCGQDLQTVLCELATSLTERATEPELVSLYYGNDLSEEEAQRLTEAVREHLNGLQVECYFGGQPLYYFLLCVE